MLKRVLACALTIALAIGLLGGAAGAIGEKNFPSGAAIRNVTLTLSSVDAHDYGSDAAGGAYFFRPSVSGRFTYQILGEGDFEAYLFTLNGNKIISGSPKTYKSGGGVIDIAVNLKQSTWYLLVVGKKITLASNGRVQSAAAPGGKVQVQVMYDYRGHAFGRPYSIGAETTVKERIRTPYQSDFYKFTAPYDATYSLKTTGGVWLRVLDAKGRLIGDSRTLRAKKGDTYYLRVNRSENKTGAYTLTAAIEKAEQEIPVSKLTLNAKKKEISDGKTAALKAKLQPAYATAKDVKWESSDPKIAAVNDEGVVKGLKPGSVTITATAKSGAKATCAVKVKAVKVKSVGVKSKLTLATGTFGELSAKLNPANATNKNVKWSSSKPAVAAVDSEGRVMALKPGKATITVTTSDGKKKARCTVTVTAAK